MKKITIVILVLLFSASVYSSNVSKVGSSGAQFLKIPVGSKYQAMADASVAMVNDVYAMYWNPAGLTEMTNNEVSFTNVNYLLDINLNYVAFARSFEDVGVFGASVTVLSMGEQEITDLENQGGTGETYTASSYAFGVSFARQLNARFSFGTSFKYIGEKIYNETASGFAVDFGTLVYTGYRSLRIGMSISNMGPEMKFSGADLTVHYDDQNGDGTNDPVNAELKTTAYDLPMIFRVGMAYDFDFNEQSSLTVAADYKDLNDFDPQGSLGAQFGFKEMFFLRGGYKFNADEETFAFGGGLKTSVGEETRLVIDYAWQDFGRLESTQRFSIGFSF